MVVTSCGRVFPPFHLQGKGRQPLSRGVSQGGKRNSSERWRYPSSSSPLESEEMFCALSETIDAGIFLWDDRDLFLYVNPFVLKTLGYSWEELSRMEVWMIIHPEDQGKAIEYGRARREGRDAPQWYEIRMAAKSGKSLWFDVCVRTIPYHGRVLYVATALDISMRKEAEAMLRESEKKYRELADLLPQPIFECDASGRITLANQEAFQCYGYTEEDLSRGVSLWETVVPEEREKATEVMSDRMKAGSRGGGEYNVRRKDGSIFQAQIYSAPVWREGKPAGLRGVIIDISDRKRAEAERDALEVQVRHAQKLESLGFLAGGIAHDFNNLLMSALGNLELALQNLSMNGENNVGGLIERARKAALKAADLTGQLLAYSGRTALIMESLSLSSLVEELEPLLELSVSKKCSLRFDLSKDIPLIYGDPVQLRQVVVNLAINGSEALGKEEGQVRIVTGKKKENDREWPYLEVVDTGCGMDKATKEKIFDPFFSTKFLGRGLGLAAVAGIVRSHGAMVEVESEVGKGSRFRIFFPPFQGEREQPEGSQVSTNPLWRGEGLILLVEDERDVREVTFEMLESLGFQPLTASNGLEALDLFATPGLNFRAVLLDLTMPKMDGAETFREIRRRGWETPVIVCSGFSGDETRRRFGEEQPNGYLQKPFSLISLRDSLQKTLS